MNAHRYEPSEAEDMKLLDDLQETFRRELPRVDINVLPWLAVVLSKGSSEPLHATRCPVAPSPVLLRIIMRRKRPMLDDARQCVCRAFLKMSLKNVRNGALRDEVIETKPFVGNGEEVGTARTKQSLYTLQMGN